MKAAKREIYLVLAGEVNWELCAFCRFAECSGSVCDFAGLECHHPLSGKVMWQRGRGAVFEDELAPGDDCWGFRPEYDVAFIADLVGVVLANGWDGATWWQEEDGTYKIAGIEV